MSNISKFPTPNWPHSGAARVGHRKPKPPAHLSPEAQRLWKSILEDHTFTDRASLAMLSQLCESLDGIRECQAEIKREGRMIASASGKTKKVNPLLPIENTYRKAFVSIARALRLDLSPEF